MGNGGKIFWGERIALPNSSLTLKTNYGMFSLQMKTFEEMRTLLVEQRRQMDEIDLGTERNKLGELKKYHHSPFPIIISGMRRAGKSTLLAQLAHKFYPKGDYFYVNFDDERFLSFTVSDFSKLHELLVELFGDYKTFLLDEIQNIEGWERFVNRMIREGYKFYITGSNASLLSKELGTRLTGRYLPIELFPFSFDEYLRFNKIALPDFSRISTIARGKLGFAFRDYIGNGGIPQALQYPQLPVHKTLYDDIINRDVVARYGLTETKSLRELAFYLLSNISSLVSYNKLKELLKLGSVNTVSSYIDYLQTGWLIFTINRYAYSVKQQQIANKKIYCVDTGLVKSIAFSFSEDRGKFLENIIYLKLRQLFGEDVYYYKTKKGDEVDFYLSKQKILIQACHDFTQPATRERELRALSDAMSETKIKSGLILTGTEKENFEFEKKNIRVLPTPEWLLDLKGNL